LIQLAQHLRGQAAGFFEFGEEASAPTALQGGVCLVEAADGASLETLLFQELALWVRGPRWVKD
jgi:hypothetical protein